MYLLQRVTELYQLILTARIIDEQKNLRTPEFHMLLPKAEKILANLMIYEALAYITPGLRRSRIMDDQKYYDQQADTASGIESIYKKHRDTTDDGTETSGVPIKVVERRAEIWGRADREQKASETRETKLADLLTWKGGKRTL